MYRYSRKVTVRAVNANTKGEPSRPNNNVDKYEPSHNDINTDDYKYSNKSNKKDEFNPFKHIDAKSKTDDTPSDKRDGELTFSDILSSDYRMIVAGVEYSKVYTCRLWEQVSELLGLETVMVMFIGYDERLMSGMLTYGPRRGHEIIDYDRWQPAISEMRNENYWHCIGIVESKKGTMGQTRPALKMLPVSLHD